MKIGFLGLVLILALVLAIVWYITKIRVRLDLRPRLVSTSGFRGGGGGSIGGRGGVLTTSATATAAQTNPALLTWM